jgi:hypothetical protein
MTLSSHVNGVKVLGVFLLSDADYCIIQQS